jgi:hypothetical protein
MTLNLLDPYPLFTTPYSLLAESSTRIHHEACPPHRGRELSHLA